MGKKFKCKDCGYLWESKKVFGNPWNCPSCKSNKIKDYTEEEIIQKEANRHIETLRIAKFTSISLILVFSLIIWIGIFRSLHSIFNIGSYILFTVYYSAVFILITKIWKMLDKEGIYFNKGNIKTIHNKIKEHRNRNKEDDNWENNKQKIIDEISD